MPIRPTDITLSLRRPARWSGWMPTFTGDGFNLLTPKPDDVRIADIAHGLAYKWRYAGQASPLTVAEHCLMVETIIGILWPSEKDQLAGLLHDACQAYIHDIQTPVRKFVRVQLPNGDLIEWATLEQKLNGVIAKHIGLPARFWSRSPVKAANILAVALEKQQCPILQRTLSSGLPEIPDEVAHLRREYLDPATVEQRFIERFTALAPAKG